MHAVPQRSEREKRARRRGAIDGLFVGAGTTLLLFSAFFFSSGDSATAFLLLGIGAVFSAIAAVLITLHVRSILRRARAASDAQALIDRD